MTRKFDCEDIFDTFGAWVLYMFYARLRDIADELLKFRIAYEMAEERKLRPSQTPRQPPGPSEAERYLPKPR